ncbi:WD40 repeat-like protein [Xylona heveae TC161]|uniref:WD40 repeat-like protein n=1 Tax=Xylona heveae (strain CBS 132557 / TC161) TaxID=1328760 RepID=A0A165AKL1_XYLHT|nr:WD40 repeat-like protein [Xylona heveae TC161]KZF20639.1 WD40 repeat-like protein [Xylona heveae TC161]
MSRSADPGHFFQTETALEKSQRKTIKSSNTNGDPIKLTSKVLAVVPDPADAGRAYVAESAGVSGDKSTIYRGPTAPLTSLAITSTTVYAGCWDKAIWSWDISSRAPQRRFVGHGDFVKALLCVRLGGKDLLVSGGADAAIIIWDLTSGAKLHTLKGHTRGIQDLALDPASIIIPDANNANDSTAQKSEITIFSAGSDREIRQWQIAVSGQKAQGNSSSSSSSSTTGSSDGIVEASEITQTSPLIRHETSVYRLRFDADDDLWTASADNSAKCLSRERAWEDDTVLAHPDFVRDVVIDDEAGWAITACRDEEIRVWDKSTGSLIHTFSGHFDEVTGLAILQGDRQGKITDTGTGKQEQQQQQQQQQQPIKTLISVSIDATLRKWNLDPKDMQAAAAAAASSSGQDEEAEQQGDEDNKVTNKEKKNNAKASLMTEEEERELAELMDDDDE